MSEPFDVVFEDERVLAVSKPVGVAVIPGRGEIGEPLNALVAKRLGARVFVVHRIDREASGLVLFAKDALSHKQLSLLFQGHAVHKTYLALVLGRMAGSGTIDKPLRAFGSGRVGVGEPGKASLTRWREARAFSGASLIEAEPVTGRRHQLRVHLYAAGHPILGDPLYGKPLPVGGAPRLMLHAWKLALAAPGFALDLVAEPPPDFAAVLAAQ